MCASVTCAVAGETCSVGICRCGTRTTCAGDDAGATCDAANNRCICGTVGASTSQCTNVGETCQSDTCMCGTHATCTTAEPVCDAANNECLGIFQRYWGAARFI